MTSLPLLLGLAALGAAGVVMVLAFSARPARSRTAGALASIETYYSRPTALPDGGSAPYGVQPLPPLLERMRGVVARFSPPGTATKIQHRLDMAGNPGTWTP